MLEALIPYLPVTELTLPGSLPVVGGARLGTFGPLVVVGVLLGRSRAFAFARRKGIPQALFRNYALWVLGTAFVLSHWVSVFFYFPQKLQRDPWILLELFNGMSSMGGFFGALVGGLFYLRVYCPRRGVGAQSVPTYADASTYGVLIGWCFGRAACSTVHDHPGMVVPEGTFLAVGPWPDGLWRYDLGLLEMIFAIVLTLLVYVVLRWEQWAPGRLTGFVLTVYAPFRFFLDSLRSTEPVRGVLPTPDERYAGLTPAQWFTFGFFVLGVWLLFIRKPSELDRRHVVQPAGPEGEGEGSN